MKFHMNLNEKYHEIPLQYTSMKYCELNYLRYETKQYRGDSRRLRASPPK